MRGGTDTDSSAPAARPTLSIVLPAYNETRSIETAIRSLLDQVEAPLEILVVDDASTDDTAACVEKLIECDERARRLVRLVRSSENIGAAGTRNLGAGEARGDLIFFAEADGAYPRNTVARIRSAAARDKDDRVYRCPAQRRPFPGRGGWTRFWLALFEARHALELAGRWPIRSGWVFYRRRFLEEGGYDRRFDEGEDLELLDRLDRAGYRREAIARWVFQHREPITTGAVFRRFYRAGRRTAALRARRGTLGTHRVAALGLVVLALLAPLAVMLAVPIVLTQDDGRIGWYRINLHRRRGRASCLDVALFPYRYYGLKLAVALGVLRSTSDSTSGRG